MQCSQYHSYRTGHTENPLHWQHHPSIPKRCCSDSLWMKHHCTSITQYDVWKATCLVHSPSWRSLMNHLAHPHHSTPTRTGRSLPHPDMHAVSEGSSLEHANHKPTCLSLSSLEVNTGFRETPSMSSGIAIPPRSKNVGAWMNSWYISIVHVMVVQAQY